MKALHEAKVERFVLLQKSADLVLNELVMIAAECLPEEIQKKIRATIAEIWLAGGEVRDFILEQASPELSARIKQLYPERTDRKK